MNRRVSGLGLAIAGGVVNLIAVLFAFVLTLVTIVHTVGPARSSGGDSFSGGQTVAGWGTFTDPDGDCRCTREGQALILQVPAGSHDLKARTLNAPRVLREVQGDFRIDVKVIANQGDAEGYHAPGLLLWTNRGDYLRLERVQNGPRAFIALELHAGGRLENNQNAFVPDKDAWLRLQRRGGQLVAFYRLEGGEWTPLTPVTMTLPDKVSVGVAAVNVSSGPLEARFADLNLDSK